MDAAEEARLVARARAGDGRAFADLIDAHQSAVRAFLRRLVGNAADADDLAQETFVRLWELLGRLGEGARLRTFACGVAFQCWRQFRRTAWRRRAREDAYAALADNDVEPPGREAARLALRRALAELPEAQQAALALCLAQDFSHAEAAEALGLPVGTVKSHVTRGRARLLAALTPPEQGA